jgi:hypothetical protein
MCGSKTDLLVTSITAAINLVTQFNSNHFSAVNISSLLYIPFEIVQECGGIIVYPTAFLPHVHVHLCHASLPVFSEVLLLSCCYSHVSAVFSSSVSNVKEKIY